MTPSVNYYAPIQSQFEPTRNEAVSLQASLPNLKVAEFADDLEGVLSSATRKLPLNMKIRMIGIRETKCQHLHGAGSVQFMVARGSGCAGRRSQDRQSQHRPIEMDK